MIEIRKNDLQGKSYRSVIINTFHGNHYYNHEEEELHIVNVPLQCISVV